MTPRSPRTGRGAPAAIASLRSASSAGPEPRANVLWGIFFPQRLLTNHALAGDWWRRPGEEPGKMAGLADKAYLREMLSTIWGALTKPHQAPRSVRLSKDASGSVWPDRAPDMPPPSLFPRHSTPQPTPSTFGRCVASSSLPASDPRRQRGRLPGPGCAGGPGSRAGCRCTARRERALRCGPRAEDCGVSRPARRAGRGGRACRAPLGWRSGLRPQRPGSRRCHRGGGGRGEG